MGRRLNEVVAPDHIRSNISTYLGAYRSRIFAWTQNIRMVQPKRQFGQQVRLPSIFVEEFIADVEPRPMDFD
jgi:hypothetical protein